MLLEKSQVVITEILPRKLQKYYPGNWRDTAQVIGLLEKYSPGILPR